MMGADLVRVYYIDHALTSVILVNRIKALQKTGTIMPSGNDEIIHAELTAEQVRDLRLMTGKTQEKAAADLHKRDGAFWRKYESEKTTYRCMPSYYVELFCLKNNIPYPPF